MRDFTRIIAYMLAGAIAFWTPDILLQVRRGYDFNGGDAWLLMILLPWTLFCIYRVLLSVRGRRAGGPSMAVYMILGVWMLGSSAMTAGATFVSGGLASPARDGWIPVVVGSLPQYTFMMATYDGSLYGLVVATALMGLLHLKFEREYWIFPPAIFKLLKKVLPSSFN